MVSKLFGVSIRRGKLLVLWDDSSKNFQLPFCEVDLREGALPQNADTEVFRSYFLNATGIAIESCGEWVELCSSRPRGTSDGLQSDFPNASDFWSYLVFYAPPEISYGAQVLDNGVAWLPLEDICKNFPVSQEVALFVTKYLRDPGNSYTKITTVSGIPTFAHLATGEILHSQQGPFEEAELLYIAPCGIRHATGEFTIYDCGLGCGTLVIAACEAFLKNANLSILRVVSFDLEKNGIKALLRNIASFVKVQPYVPLLEKILDEDEFVYQFSEGKILYFNFVKGDFASVIMQPKMLLPLADAVFFDFFSPRSHPHLWDLAVMSALNRRCAKNCVLSTYSSATAVRAVLAAAGFFIGEGVPSGKKNCTTLASPSLQALKKPLSKSFLQTFERSQAKFLPNVDHKTQQRIEANLQSHKQFSWEV